MRGVFERIGELLHLNRILQQLLGILEIVHELNAHLRRLRCAIRAKNYATTDLSAYWIYQKRARHHH